MVTVMKGLRTPWGMEGGDLGMGGGGRRESDGEEDGRVRN